MKKFLKKAFVRLTLLGFAVCTMTFAAIGTNPQQVAADICTVNGRDCWFGYFTGAYDGGPGTLRLNVISAPALLNVWDMPALINNIGSHMACAGGTLTNAGAQNATGSAFIVLTMLGYPPGTSKDVACQQFGAWASLVSDLAGHTSFGVMYNYGGLNTRSTGTDVAWYPSAQTTALSIVFYSPVDGLPMYAIKKDCANPVGERRTVTRNFDLTPSIRATVNGANVSSVEPGQQLNFEYRMTNNGNTNSASVNCWRGIYTRAGYFATPGTPEPGGTSAGLGCPRTFGGGTTVLTGEGPITAVANTTYCRTLFVDPATQSGGTRGTEVCIPVVSKPYLKVFGGDVAAGGGFASIASPTNCTPNNSADIITWNKLAAGSYAGAGAQYAAYVLDSLSGFGTAQRSSGAPTPTGLAFSNTGTDAPNGNFGGHFGSVPCIRDYFGTKPTSGVESLASLHSGRGIFESAGATTFPGGTLQPGDKWTIYVDGDLFITGNITFGGSWTADTIPMLEVIVRGNIYIRNNVTRLDGSYIAQPHATGGGTIYTCTTAASAPSLAGGAFYNNCTNKLTVNGSFVAQNVWFLRTRGTLDQSNAGNGPGTTSIAEEFNYGPAFWIAQPTSTNETDGQVDNYDAITSLPPVL